MSVDKAKLMDLEISLEEKLIAAGLGYPLAKEDAVKAYKTMLIPRTDTPENADCQWCFGVGHDFDAGLPCVGCCEPAKPVLDLIESNAELRIERDRLKAEIDALRRELKEKTEHQCGYGDDTVVHKFYGDKHAMAALTEMIFELESLRKVNP